MNLGQIGLCSGSLLLSVFFSDHDPDGMTNNEHVHQKCSTDMSENLRISERPRNREMGEYPEHRAHEVWRAEDGREIGGRLHRT